MVKKKCWFCRHHKRKCDRPNPWPEKCQNCQNYGHECSEDSLPEEQERYNRIFNPQSDSAESVFEVARAPPGSELERVRSSSIDSITASVSQSPRLSMQTGSHTEQRTFTFDYGNAISEVESNNDGITENLANVPSVNWPPTDTTVSLHTIAQLNWPPTNTSRSGYGIMNGSGEYQSGVPGIASISVTNTPTFRDTQANSPLQIQDSDRTRVSNIPRLLISQDEGGNLLHKAIRNQDVEEVKRLIALGVDAKFANSEGETPLYATFRSGDCKCTAEPIRITLWEFLYNSECKHFKELDLSKTQNLIQLLLHAGADIHTKGPQGNTLLHVILFHSQFASEKSRSELENILKSLEKHGVAKDLVEPNHAGRTPLHCHNLPHYALAVFVDNHLPLLETAVNIQDSQKSTPLHFAQDDVQTFGLLLKLLHNHGQLNTYNMSPLTALFHKRDLMHGKYGGWESVFRIPLFEKLLYIFNKHHPIGELLASHLLTHGNCAINQIVLHSVCGVLPILTKSNYIVDFNVKDDLGRTPLHHAITNAMCRFSEDTLIDCHPYSIGVEMCWTLIFQAHVDVNLQDHDGNSPLLAMMKLFIHLMIKVDYRNTLWETLSVAHIAGYLTRFLTFENADPCLEDVCGQSPRSLANEAWEMFQSSLLFQSSFYDEKIDSGRKIVEKYAECYPRDDGHNPSLYRMPWLYPSKGIGFVNELVGLNLAKTIELLKKKIRYVLDLILNDSENRDENNSGGGRKRKRQSREATPEPHGAKRSAISSQPVINPSNTL